MQDKVRYVFLGLSDGGLVPADADLTWQRRFGDCKGKTVLLLALLHGLGIAADPAIVSSQLGDGMDERLPMVGLFDHVIVRTAIGGKTYWLDGTRTGDLRLADIQVPDFRFALPLRTPGATLEPLVVPVPAKPLYEYTLRVDMRSGATLPFPFHVEEISRGDEALGTHLRLDNMTPELRQQALRDYFVSAYSDVEPKSYSATWDPATGEEKLVMDGLEKHDWRWSYEADRAAVGWKADFDRPAGPHRDAPFAVGYPDYTVMHETILLPNGGQGFVNQTANVDRTVAGIEYYRQARLDGATFTIETRQRAVAREFPAADAPAAQKALRDLAKDQPLLGVTAAYRSTPEEKQAILSSKPETAEDYLRRARGRGEINDIAGALADAEEAIRLDPNSGNAFWMRAGLRENQGDLVGAITDLRHATTLLPEAADAQMALARLLAFHGDSAAAIALYDQALTRSPNNAQILAGRAQAHLLARHYDQALSDGAAAIRHDPALDQAYETRLNAYIGKGMTDAAIAEGKAAVAANPRDDYLHVLLAATYQHFHHPDESAAEFDQAIRLKPSASNYLARARYRPPADMAGRRADVATALKLDPDAIDAQNFMVWLDLESRDYAAVIANATRILVARPADPNISTLRGIAFELSGRHAEANRDFATVRSTVGSNVGGLNNLCWNKATHNAALASALGDCDAALKITPDATNALDSRGFVLFRLGRFQDSIASYDRALALSPGVAASLYGRGLAKLRLGRMAEGQADLKAAKAADAGVEQEFANYGVTA